MVEEHGWIRRLLPASSRGFALSEALLIPYLGPESLFNKTVVIKGKGHGKDEPEFVAVKNSKVQFLQRRHRTSCPVLPPSPVMLRPVMTYVNKFKFELGLGSTEERHAT